MDNLRIMFSVAIYNLRKWSSNPRVYLIFVLQILYLHSLINPLKEFCDNTNYKITPYIFPFFTSHPTSVLLTMLGVIFLLCDAPFIENDHPYLLLRTGRRMWTLGNILYIALATLIYTLFIVVFSVLLLCPNLQLGMEWGKVIGTLAQTTVAYQHNIFIPFSFSIYNSYLPLRAMTISILNFWMISFLLGLLIFVLNVRISRFAGILATTMLVLWQLIVPNTWTGFTKYSPVTWISLSRIDANGSTLYPNLPYIYMVSITGMILLIIFSLYSTKKCDIEVTKSV